VTAHVVLNGALVARDRARIAPNDLGFLVGDGVFETVHVQDGVPLFLDAHLLRLAGALETLAIPTPFDAAALREQIARLLVADAATAASARLRITVTRGPGRPPAVADGAPTVLVSLDAWSASADAANGVGVEVSRHRRQPHPLHAIKATSYMPSAWLRREATRTDTFDVLQCNTHGDLAEGSFTNVFVVGAARAVRTPAVADGCLPGVTRAVVLDLARAAGYECREGGVAAAALATAAEIFLTGSLIGIVAVCRVDGVARPDPCPGPVTAALQAAYASRIRSELLKSAAAPGSARVS
jgi:branched-chain amino acid aminotransferase